MKNIKENIMDTILDMVYESKRILTTHSITEAAYFDLIQINKANRKLLENKKKERQKIQKTIYYLKKAKYLEIYKNKELKISNKGIIKVILSKSKKIKKNKNQKYFYVVIFDIPENLRKVRDLFRDVLYNFGSDKLQKSVFMIESEDGYKLVKELIKASKISEYVKILKCVKIEEF
jgi:CRISPR-associated endonuclease Cas2